MKDRKLEYFLNRLPEKELAQFRTELNNSLLQRDQILLKLLDLVSTGEHEDEQLYETLYPEKSFSEKQIRNLRSSLFTKLMDFLATNEFTNSSHYDGYLLKALNRIQATHYFPQISNKAERKNKKLSLSRYRMKGIAMHKYEKLRFQLLTQGRKNVGYSEAIQSAEEAFVVRMIHYKLGAETFQRISGQKVIEKSEHLWPAILKSLESGAYSDSALIQTYYLLYKTANAPDDRTHYENAKNQLTQFGAEIAKDELEQLYSVTLNHCILAINKGDRSYLKEAFHTYQEMLERELFSGPAGIAHWHFKIIVTTALRLEKYDWAEAFMDKYHSFLSETMRETTYNYCKGTLAFYRKDYEISEQLMNQVLENFEDPFLGPDARAYLLKIYYETGNATGMDALSTSFRLFLRRHNQLSEKRRQNYHEFVRFFRRLIALTPGDVSRIEKLRKEIMDSPPEAGKEWVLEKIKTISQLKV